MPSEFRKTLMGMVTAFDFSTGHAPDRVRGGLKVPEFQTPRFHVLPVAASFARARGAIVARSQEGRHRLQGENCNCRIASPRRRAVAERRPTSPAPPQDHV